jgi:hypothetical protein
VQFEQLYRELFVHLLSSFLPFVVDVYPQLYDAMLNQLDDLLLLDDDPRLHDANVQAHQVDDEY